MVGIRACPSCASLRIKAASFADGVAVGGGELSLYVCEECHFRGMPIELDEDGYRQLVAATHGATDHDAPDEDDEDDDIPEELAAIAATKDPGKRSRGAALFIGIPATGVALFCGFFLTTRLISIIALQDFRLLAFQSVLWLAVFFAAAVAVGLIALRLWRGPDNDGTPTTPPWAGP